MDMAELFNKEDAYYLFKWSEHISTRKRINRNTEFLRRNPYFWSFMVNHYAWTGISVIAPDMKVAEEEFNRWLYEERYFGPINIESTDFLQDNITRIPSKKNFAENYKFMTYDNALNYSSDKYYGGSLNFDVDDEPSRVHVMSKNSLIIAYYSHELLLKKWQKATELFSQFTPEIKNVSPTLIMDHINLLKP